MCKNIFLMKFVSKSIQSLNTQTHFSLDLESNLFECRCVKIKKQLDVRSCQNISCWKEFWIFFFNFFERNILKIVWQGPSCPKEFSNFSYSWHFFSTPDFWRFSDGYLTKKEKIKNKCAKDENFIWILEYIRI